MSTLEKTIDILNTLPENQIEIIYSYALFLHSQHTRPEFQNTENINEIFKNLVGVLPDSGKTLEQYREERITQTHPCPS